ncbi:44755_t:CDS:2, partial [Gigaspora margarita]
MKLIHLHLPGVLIHNNSPNGTSVNFYVAVYWSCYTKSGKAKGKAGNFVYSYSQVSSWTLSLSDERVRHLGKQKK